MLLLLAILFFEVNIKIENKFVNSLSMPRPCRAVDVEREHKPVTTYTIEGAYYNRASFLVGEKYKMNESSENNNGSLLNTSHITLGDISLYTEPLSTKSLWTLDNDHKQSPTLTSRNVPIPPDTISNAVDRRKMMMNYDLLSLSPSIHKKTPATPNAIRNHIYSNDHHPASKLSTQKNTSGTPATITNPIYSDNIQQPMDSPHSTLTSQSALLAKRHLPSNNNSPDPNSRQVTKWRKFPRWAERLSQSKQIHTPPLSSSHPLSKEQSRTATPSSTRSTRTIPRYAFVYEN